MLSLTVQRMQFVRRSLIRSRRFNSEEPKKKDVTSSPKAGSPGGGWGAPKQSIGPYGNYRGKLSENLSEGKRSVMPFWGIDAKTEWLRGSYSLLVCFYTFCMWLGMYGVLYALIAFTPLPEYVPQVKVRKALNDDFEISVTRTHYLRVMDNVERDRFGQYFGRAIHHPEHWSAYQQSLDKSL
eukprot:Hpha_TRINITY_DN27281_c0_g1::TRINITY_DN27281_c0_g1_i1::g.140714::m.140714